MLKLLAVTLLSICCCGAATAATDAEVTAMIDRLKIQDVIVSYATAHNLNEAERYRPLFTADAEIILPNGRILAKGIEAIVAAARNDRKRFNADAKPGESRYGSLRDVVTNITIDIEGERATGHMYVTNIAFNPASKKPEVLQMGRYEDEYLKQKGQWRIARRQIWVDWGNDELARSMRVGPYTPEEHR